MNCDCEEAAEYSEIGISFTGSNEDTLLTKSWQLSHPVFVPVFANFIRNRRASF